MVKRIVPLLILALVGLAAGFWFGHRNQAPANAPDAAVAQLLATRLPDLAGNEQAISQWRGKTLVINFWAPWCGPCVEEMPDLQALSSEFKGKNVQFVGIGIDTAPNMIAFEQKVKVDYPLLVAGYAGTDLARALGNKAGALPYTVVVDPQGRLHYQKLGRITSDEVRSALRPTR
ncbi:TlpA disulfide reductase family protein [Pandoraea sp. XJJ-1]|uniref:TlpA family protein disulfide reductase n=1 Tax=unclassified Pandoraea TaxID=2624094 RepID=UPI00034D0AD4|nr:MULTISPECIES: TlpA disulfide reductase family protein [unclassified Pandoraea]MBN9116968.1 TlpA family protein disulfide reductase [Pandoraea sp.]OJY19083.1 MAG: alkyl hydroperoxide reductase [Pandoraea sp. 64-18]WAL82406.1 TlpA disulfide reductase family protein [Pandoraea sp. XJJ-1]BDD92583.1 thioredoxin [Pandoraea sp. NE5]